MVVPISTWIIVLLCIVYFSYMQTIAAYPSGGGSVDPASCTGIAGIPLATRYSILVGVAFSCCGADIHDRPSTT
jgi:hypothetical protein